MAIGLKQYFGLSLLAAGVVIYHAFATRQHFYPATLYLSTSKLAVAVVGNLGFATAMLLHRLVIKVFLGTLRDIEMEMINDRLNSAVMESLLALTVFKDEFGAFFIAMFATLVFVKVLHWLVQNRVEFIEVTPTVSRLQHLRIVAFMTVLLVVDCLFLSYTVQGTIASGGASVQLLFAFEYVIQASDIVRYFLKYAMSMVDLWLDGRWESKGTYVFYLELVTDLLHLFVYVLFFGMVFTNYGMPLHLVRDLYSAFRNFRNRITDFLRFRQVTARLDRLPDASREDLERCDGVCIICREEMTTSGSNKKLGCGHVFHLHCLRSWLERQQNCPTCRGSVFPRRQREAPAPAAAVAANAAAAGAAPGGAAQAGAGGGGAAGAPAPAPAGAGAAGGGRPGAAPARGAPGTGAPGHHHHHQHVHHHHPYQPQGARLPLHWQQHLHHLQNLMHGAHPPGAQGPQRGAPGQQAPRGSAAESAGGSGAAASSGDAAGPSSSTHQPTATAGPGGAGTTAGSPSTAGATHPHQMPPVLAALLQAQAPGLVPGGLFSAGADTPPSAAPLDLASILGSLGPQWGAPGGLPLAVPPPAFPFPGYPPLGAAPMFPTVLPPLVPTPPPNSALHQQAAAAAAAAALAAAAAVGAYNPLGGLVILPPSLLPPTALGAGTSTSAGGQPLAALAGTDPKLASALQSVLERQVEMLGEQLARVKAAAEAQAANAAAAAAAAAAQAAVSTSTSSQGAASGSGGPGSQAAGPSTGTAPAPAAESTQVGTSAPTAAVRSPSPSPADAAADSSAASPTLPHPPASTHGSQASGTVSAAGPSGSNDTAAAPSSSVTPPSAPAASASGSFARLPGETDEQAEIRRRRLARFEQQQQQSQSS